MNELLVVFAVTALISYISTEVLIRVERGLGFVGIDVHKPHKPEVAKSAGPAFITSLITATLITWLLTGALSKALVAHAVAIVLAGVLGFIDDLRILNAHVKVVLSSLVALPVLIAGAYTPYPYVPLVGTLRLTVIYPAALFIIYAVGLNGLNMIDTHNGIAPSVTLLYAVNILVASVTVLNTVNADFIVLDVILIAILTGYLRFNIYPAKIFNGNSGAFFLGAYIASLMILSRSEYYTVLSLIPLFLNGFQILVSFKGFKEHREVRVRPTKLLDDGVIVANKDPNAPLTLIQLLTLEGLSERGIYVAYITLIAINMLAAYVIYYLLLMIT